MFLKKLLPADGNFFEQLNQHAGHMLDAAKALSLLIEHYPNTQLRQKYTQAVIDAELVWIGPSPQSIRDLGDKVTARHIALKANAPMAPGTTVMQLSSE